MVLRQTWHTIYMTSIEYWSLDSLLGKATQGLSVLDSHLVEIDGDALYLYGSGALESLDRNWSIQTAGSIASISFVFIDFDEIVPVLPKLKIKFPNFVHLKFKETNLVMLQQFNALAHVRRLEQLTVDAEGNPIVTFTLWKYYVLFRLSHFNLQKINSIEVTQNDMVMAERLFGILAYIASSDVPYSFFVQETKDRKNFCQSYIQEMVKEATDISMKNESFQKLWPQMFIELVRDAVIEIRNKDAYMKLCLQRVVGQKS
nr:leucine-rich repeat-containing protein 49-like [Anolis sagrei ordinatus]